jgi:phage-related protein
MATPHAREKPLVWLDGEVRSPPLGPAARKEVGYLLRRLQMGQRLSMPEARPMPSVGRRCVELRVWDASVTWRVVLRVDPDAIVILDVFAKKTAKTPRAVIENCRRRLRDYDHALR